jgi:CheY-like chemotaxis protein
MMILIVEDDENKGEQLQRFLRSTYPAVELKLAKSLNSAVRFVKEYTPSLIILDMTLPSYDPSSDEPGGGAAQSFGGREFLRQMDRFDIDVPVIVFTQFETFGKPPQQMGLPELDKQLQAEHGNVYRGAVYYHASIESWEAPLKSLIDSEIAD